MGSHDDGPRQPQGARQHPDQHGCEHHVAESADTHPFDQMTWPAAGSEQGRESGASRSPIGMAPRDGLLVAAIVLMLGDVLVTVPNWHLEGNPVVVALGPVVWVTLKIALTWVIASLWFGSGVRDHWIGLVGAGGLCLVYLATLAVNVATVGGAI